MGRYNDEIKLATETVKTSSAEKRLRRTRKNPELDFGDVGGVEFVGDRNSKIQIKNQVN